MTLTAESMRAGVGRLLVSRRGAWLTILLGLLIAGAVSSAFGRAEPPAVTEQAPASAESTQVGRELATFPGSDIQPVLLVATRPDGSPLTRQDLQRVGEIAASVAPLSDHRASPPIPSDDGLAGVAQVPVRVGESGTDNAGTVRDIRAAIAAQLPSDLHVEVTGGPAFGADIAASFDGADLRLLLVTLAIVAVLLLLTYRSPVLWLLPLTVVGIADQVAARVTAAVGNATGLPFDAGIISVLVFGAGTNYALLLVSRYREHLNTEPDHRIALGRAWRAALPAIVASNLTVVLALATLVLASVPGTRGLGVAAAVGLLIALGFTVTLLPAALAVAGRRVFWPFVPRVGDESRSRRNGWARVASGVMARPRLVVAAAVLGLAGMATGLIGTQVGLAQTDRFRVTAESGTGLETLGRHFPPGEAQPLQVVSDTESVTAVRSSVEALPDVSAVRPGPSHDGRSVLTVVGQSSPGTQESLRFVDAVRATVHAVPDADAQVGGGEAVERDARAANRADLLLVAPLILLVSALVLAWLLRSVTAPVLLLAVNVLSAVAAIGAGSWVGRQVLGQPALDGPVPLAAFLFLVALGIDYTIFLVHRARSEAEERGTRAGMVEAVGRTGAVITSAGVVLAGVFAALGMLPLITLAQLGLIVGLGVLVDTFLVRTLLIPGLVALLGDRIWWPSRPASARSELPPSESARELSSAGARSI